MFKKILVANRGEIALRIQRACRELGIKTVVVLFRSRPRRQVRQLADESVCIGPAPSAQSYLNMPAIISAAEVTDAEAIHPGYGFLSRKRRLRRARGDSAASLFIGPTRRVHPPDGRQGVGQAGHDQVPACPACPAPKASCPTTRWRSSRIASAIGYPVIIKAAGGGGGRGMRVVHTEAALVQCGADHQGRSRGRLRQPGGVHGEVPREPAPRRNPGPGRPAQERRLPGRARLLHAAPPPEGDRGSAGAAASRARLIEKIGERCADACKKIGYRGAGTFEFLYENGEFYFIEMNTRVQVEHPVTELITGVDIVQDADPRWRRARSCRFTQRQMSSSAAMPSSAGSTPKTPSSSCHLPAASRPGTRRAAPACVWTRTSTPRYFVPPNYDSMIGKVIVHGDTREQAMARMRTALSETVVEGIKTNIPLHRELMVDARFMEGGTNIHYLEKWLARSAAS